MRKIQILAMLCALLLFAGCATPKTPTDSATPPETIAPSADTVSSDGETTQKGTALPLPTSDYFHHAMVKITFEDRCAATSLGRMAETERGYYYVNMGFLYYADKNNIHDWQLVCNEPDCKHIDPDDCSAVIGNNIWYKNSTVYVLNQRPPDDPTVILQSPGDGSKWTPAFSDESFPFYHSNGCSLSTEASAGNLCINIIRMESDGFWDSYLYFVDQNGSHVVKYAEDFLDLIGIQNGNAPNQLRGDTIMPLTMEFPGSGVDLATGSELYRVSPECVEKLELPEGCSSYGAYLSGDTMIHYHPGDGFYKLDYYGGTEEKIAEAAYADGFGFCLDGEFLVETTVNYQSTAKECKFRYFDGETWTEVPIPEEFAPETVLNVFALTSDTLFLKVSQAGITQLYMIRLGEDQLIKCADFSSPIAS